MSTEQCKKLPAFDINADDARKVFKLLASQSVNDEEVSKADLLKAHAGEPAVFARLFSDIQDTIQVQDWLRFLRAEYDGQGPEKGARWLVSLLFSIKSNLHVQEWKRQAEAHKVAELVAMDIAERNTVWERMSVDERKLLPTFDINAPDAKKIFFLIASQSGGEDTIAKEDLVKAHGGDFKVPSF